MLMVVTVPSKKGRVDTIIAMLMKWHPHAGKTAQSNRNRQST